MNRFCNYENDIFLDIAWMSLYKYWEWLNMLPILFISTQKKKNSIMLIVFLLLVIDTCGGWAWRCQTIRCNRFVQQLKIHTGAFKFLKSVPRTAGADLKGLAQIYIDLAEASAKETTKLIAKLVKKSNGGAQLKQRYQTCVDTYTGAIFITWLQEVCEHWRLYWYEC